MAALIVLIIVVAVLSPPKKTKVATAGSSATTAAVTTVKRTVPTTSPPKTTPTTTPATAPPTTSPPVTAAPTQAAAPIPLSGKGQTATSSFPVVGGLTVFAARHSGTSNFAVELLDDQGSTVEVLFNAIGNFAGSVGKGVPGGSYTLKVTADGPWTVNITQPRNVPGAPLPKSFSGKGQSFIGPFHTSGGVRLAATHNGSSNFAIEVLGSDGQTVDVAVNEIGPYNGSTVVSNLDGDYYLNVTADGSWTVDLSSV